MEYRLEKISLNDILYIEGMRDYRRIHTSDKRIMTLQTFKDLEQEIPVNIICRVHKSFMVALDKISSVEKDHIKIKDVVIPIPETYKKHSSNAYTGNQQELVGLREIKIYYESTGSQSSILFPSSSII